MGRLCGYRDLPREILAQLDRITEVWKAHFGTDLVGVYLHGSITLNAFDPDSGDLDLLVVVDRRPGKEEKLMIAKELIAIDGHPRPVELSALMRGDAKHWKDPGSCVFHYSDYWTERYLKRLEDPAAEVYVLDQEFPDSDVTSYIRMLHDCGIVLYGEPVADVFAPVPDEDFFRAISAEVDDYDFHAYGARYVASNVLILGRILSFKVLKRILSKYEAGEWMKDYLPEELRYLAGRAMRIWFGGREEELPEDDLERLRVFLISEIRK